MKTPTAPKHIRFKAQSHKAWEPPYFKQRTPSPLGSWRGWFTLLLLRLEYHPVLERRGQDVSLDATYWLLRQVLANGGTEVGIEEGKYGFIRVVRDLCEQLLPGEVSVW
jgi:hypothetical protein